MMSARHFFNEAETLVLDFLESLTIVNPSLSLDKTNKGDSSFLKTTWVIS